MISEHQNSIGKVEYSGFYNTSRLIDDRLYVISNYKVDKNKVSRPSLEMIPMKQCLIILKLNMSVD